MAGKKAGIFDKQPGSHGAGRLPGQTEQHEAHAVEQLPCGDRPGAWGRRWDSPSWGPSFSSSCKKSPWPTSPLSGILSRRSFSLWNGAQNSRTAPARKDRRNVRCSKYITASGTLFCPGRPSSPMHGKLPLRPPLRGTGAISCVWAWMKNG